MKAKRLPNYPRYEMLQDGTIRNVQTQTVRPVTNGFVLLMNMRGKSEQVSVKEMKDRLYPLSKNCRTLPGELLPKRTQRKRNKITIDQVNELRFLFDAGGITLKEAELKYGISQQAAGRIVRRVAYKKLQ